MKIDNPTFLLNVLLPGCLKGSAYAEGVVKPVCFTGKNWLAGGFNTTCSLPSQQLAKILNN